MFLSRTCKILVNEKRCDYGNIYIVPKKCGLQVNFKASKLSQLDHLLVYCSFKGGYFSSVDFEMGVRLRLQDQEVSAYRD